MLDAKELSSNRRRRGIVRASVTRFEGRVHGYQEKECLTRADHVAIKSLLTKLKTLDTELKAYHYVILDLADEEALEMEQAVFDDHEDKVEELTEWLRQLAILQVQKPSMTQPQDLSLPFQKQLRWREARLRGDWRDT